MKHKIVSNYFFLLFSFCTCICFAQQSVKSPEEAEKELLQRDKEMKGSCCLPAKGTYQFINKKGNREGFSPDEMNEIINKVKDSRKKSEIVILPVGKNTRLKILSKDEINSPGFIPVNEFIEE